MKNNRFSPSRFLLLIAVGLIVSLPLMADIIPVSSPANGPANTVYASGQGYGTIYVLVDLQWSTHSAGDYTELGYAAPNAGMSCVAGVCSHVNTGVDETNQERVYTLGYVHNTILGGTSAANLFWLFNISQQGSNDLISINDMSLIVYNSSFIEVARFSCNHSGTNFCFYNYAPVAGNGQGAAGYAFHLDAAQAAALDVLITGHPEYYLGGYASFGKLGANANDGSDNIALIRGEGVVPEPTSLLMLGTGLLVAGNSLRRKLWK